MNVSLTPELEKMVHAKVRSGRYNSASEVVRSALRLLDREDSSRATQIEELRARLDTSMAALNAGQGVDGEKFMGTMLAKLDARHAKRKAG